MISDDDDVDGDAEDALERHVEDADQAADLVALVRPRRRQPGAGERVGDEAERDHRHDPAASCAASPRAPARSARRRTTMSHGSGDVLRSVKSSPPRTSRRSTAIAERRREPVPPHDPVAEASRDREDQEAEEQHEGDVHRPQHLRRHDRVGACRGGTRPSRRRPGATKRAEPALQPVGRAFLLLDVLLGAQQRLCR